MVEAIVQRYAMRSIVMAWRIAPHFRFLLHSAIVACTTMPALASSVWEDLQVCKREEDRAARIAACEKVIEQSRDPKSLLIAHNTRGLALCDTTNRCEEAIDDFNVVISLNPKIAGYFDNRARAFRAAHRIIEALADSERAIRMAPTYSFVYMGKARALEDSSRFAEALEIVEAVIERDPVNAGNWEFKGRLLGELGRFEEAYSAYSRSADLDASRSSVFKSRAITEKADGKWKQALADIQRYSSNGYDLDEVKQLKSELLEKISKEREAEEQAAVARAVAAREQAAQAEAARVEAMEEGRKQEAARRDEAEKEAVQERRRQEAERRERARLEALRDEANRQAAREEARKVARQEIADQQLQERKKIAVASAATANEGRSEAPMSSEDAERIHKDVIELSGQLAALKETLDEQRRLKDSSGGDAPTIEATIVAVQLRIDFTKKQYDTKLERLDRYLTNVRPQDRDLYTTARKAILAFPRIPFYIPGTSETGEFWIEPKIADTGVQTFSMKFVDPTSDYEKVRETISMTAAEVAEVQSALAKVRQWSVMAHQKGIRKVYSKRAVCFPQPDCPPDGETIDAKASTEIRFNVYEDGSTAGQIARNKGRFVERVNVSMESALLLDAYLLYAKRLADRDFSQGTQTKQDLDRLFK